MPIKLKIVFDLENIVENFKIRIKVTHFIKLLLKKTNK